MSAWTMAAVLAAYCICLATEVSANPDLTTSWSDRVIPLPKQMSVEGAVTVAPDRIALRLQCPGAPEVETAMGLLGRFARAGDRDASYTIAISLSSSAGVPSDVRKRLEQLPNADQAYAILPNAQSGLTIIGNTPLGVLYAARTLSQLLTGPDGEPALPLQIPLVRVTDWPDVAERGQWGGDVVSNYPWTSQWKLNTIEHSASATLDSTGQAVVKLDPAYVAKLKALGVKSVPFISHLEQISNYLPVNKRPGLSSRPDPAKPLPSDYTPGLCMSSEATRSLLGGWLTEIAAVEGVTDVMVWLSEDASKCFCEQCSGKEPYGLEVECLAAALRLAQKSHPGMRLRILLSQGSYPVNDKVIAAAPPDVGITYYDGGRTYDSSHAEMIYPLLRDYAASGRWLGVYPQITHSWRCVFPWTGPQFIRARAQEFVDKKLSCVIGYAVPANRFHEFNVMALAEWSWNSGGRSPEDFCRAYATRIGVCEPGLFARWAVLAGEAGWSFAESKLLLTAIYQPSLAVGSAPFDHRFQNAGIAKIDELENALALARESLQIAREAAVPAMVEESECLVAGLEAFGAIAKAHPLLSRESLSPQERRDLSTALDQLDNSALILRWRLLDWGSRLMPRPDGALPGRLMDTAFVLLRTCDEFRTRAAKLGVQDNNSQMRPRPLGKWDESLFASSPRAELRIGISEPFPEQGPAHVCLDFIDSAYGTTVNAVKLMRLRDEFEEVAAVSPDPALRMSKHERWHEMRLELPRTEPGDRLFLLLDLTGTPADAPAERRSCSGSVGLRLVPRPGGGR